MEDRVADVLSQRAALDNGAAAGIVLSLLLHGGLTVLAVYAAMHAAPPQMANVLNIRFAPIARPSGTVMTPAVAKPAAQPKPIKPKIESPRAEPLEPSVTKAPPEKNTVPLSPFGKSAKRGSENPVAPPKPAAETQQPSTATATADIPIGTAGVTGLEGGDFPYTIYIEKMKTLIGSHWLRPQVTSGTTTIIYFAIDRDGAIRDTKIETTSGNAFFDRAAQRAVLETSPLPPLPFGYNGTYLGVHLTFR